MLVTALQNNECANGHIYELRNIAARLHARRCHAAVSARYVTEAAGFPFGNAGIQGGFAGIKPEFGISGPQQRVCALTPTISGRDGGCPR